METSLGKRSVKFRPSGKAFWKSREGLGTRFGLWRADGEPGKFQVGTDPSKSRKGAVSMVRGNCDSWHSDTRGQVLNYYTFTIA